MAARRPEIEETEDELLNMDRMDIVRYLTDKQVLFCEVYTRTNNIRLAAKEAGYSPKTAHIMGWKLRQQSNCARYIAWLKARVVQESCLKGAELVDQYIRIAFSDITDFVTKDSFGNIKLKDITTLDGQVISKIHQRPSGFTIELFDKMKAMEKLEKYFEFMPRDWKQDLEEKKVAILEQRLEIERIKAGQISEDDDDDGFIDALKATAEEVWEDEEGGIE